MISENDMYKKTRANLGLLKIKLVNNYYKVKPISYGLNKTENRKHKINISLTSYPQRFSTLHICIKSLLNQSVKPDRIILWLTENDYGKVPKELLVLEEYGLTIKTCNEDLKPHKKYYYTMKEFPEDIIITVDDDAIYDRNLIKDLMHSFIEHPNAVSAKRVHKIVASNNIVKPYNEWVSECDDIKKPSMNLFATGVGGVLYPPHCMSNEAFNIVNIKCLCINADDIWLKYMEVLNNTPVVLAKSKIMHPITILSAQATALNNTNINQNENDKYISVMTQYYNVNLGEYID
jgi:hypothetical protein